MLKCGKIPKKVWTYKRTEFKGSFAEFCSKKGIEMYSTNSETKSCFAERNIRSLKNVIYRYLEEFWTWTYLPKLQEFVKTMNTRINRTIDLAPANVTKKYVPYLLSLTLKSRRKPLFNIGQKVRIAKKDLQFKKGYQQSFTDEIFIIHAIPTYTPATYTLTDQSGEKILGKFYQTELVAVNG